MYFNKYPYRANFAFAESFQADVSDATAVSGSGNVVANQKTFEASVTSYANDIHHVRLSNKKIWHPNQSLETLTPPQSAPTDRVRIGARFEIEISGKQGVFLRSVPGEAFGVCGTSSLFQFEVPVGTCFFGAGEKTFGTIELSGYRTKFWNTDVWSDFPASQWSDGPTDPPYFSTPYLAAKIGEEWVGFLLHNPYPAFFETPGIDESRVFVEWQRTSKHLTLGTEGGEPNLWILLADSLAELTEKLQSLVGVTPRPPLWALGYHQSRYGYGGEEDLLSLDRQFERHEIPCDALWLDLDYMDGFRVFQTNPKMFPSGLSETVEKLAEHGRRIVPILDPGVKFEPGYAIYDDGHKEDVFCRNAEGKEFVGLVWPGETVFPDFTLASVRKWWAKYVKSFANEGFAAAWIDMNDPSTGPVDPNGMLFNKGKEGHHVHHNEYALGMQMATVDGMRQARPEQRPFLLSRSGYTGSSKHSAIWTGDNVSNYFYLRISIPTSIGMSLSGLPFNGPDMGGFGGDADENLIVDWFKTGFLFPFFRNHSTIGSRAQEPFAYPISTLRILRRYIRLRYKFLPYIYNLFVSQEQKGEAILRPLLYDFSDSGLEKVDDEFMVGPSVLQAPFVSQTKSRSVLLPGILPWYDARTGSWAQPGSHSVRNHGSESPMYIRSGAIIPMRPGTPSDNKTDLREVNFHLFVPPVWSGETEFQYVADDGESIGYRGGAQSRLKILVVAVDGNLAISTSSVESGYGPVNASFVIHGEFASVRIDGADVEKEKAKVTLTGKPLDVTVLRV